MAAAKILVVEDERITGEDIKMGLESAGYTVPAIVSSGEEAIQEVEKFLPDLVLMDIRLRGEMDGIEAAEHIRSRFKIPVIYLTAFSDEITMKRAKETQPSGFIIKKPFGFLHKPFDDNELQTAIEITLKHHELEKKFSSPDIWIQKMLSNISDAVISTDPRGRINFINSTAQDITCMGENEVLDRNIRDLFITITNDGLEDDFGLKIPQDLVLKVKDGSEVAVDGNLTAIEGADGRIEGYVVIFSI
jgi:two-component system, response regulator PdtaR